MNTTLVAIVLVVITSVGLYIGITNLTQQFTVDTSGSRAGLITCAPEKSSVKPSEPVQFNASIPEGTSYYWSAPEGTASFVLNGPVTVQYARIGEKTVSLFYRVENSWTRTTCSVQVQ